MHLLSTSDPVMNLGTAPPGTTDSDPRKSAPPETSNFFLFKRVVDAFACLVLLVLTAPLLLLAMVAGQADLARPGDVYADAARMQRPAVHHLQNPHHVP